MVDEHPLVVTANEAHCGVCPVDGFLESGTEGWLNTPGHGERQVEDAHPAQLMSKARFGVVKEQWVTVVRRSAPIGSGGC